MRTCLFITCGILTLFSCGRHYSGDAGFVVAKVGDKQLTREKINELMPKNPVSESDSALISGNIAKRWAIDILLDEAAGKNVKAEKDEIDRLVADYRRSLIRHRYQEQLIRDRVSSIVADGDKRAFYEANKPQFVLNDNLIKGLFLKVPKSAPAIAEIRKCYTSETEESLEKIEKYSLQNAIIYDYFYDHWVNFNDVMAKIPHKLPNPTQFLRANKHLEVSDSSFCYFLNISERLLKGDMAPYDYVEGQIHDVIINQRKVDFLRNFEENVYTEAVKSGKVKFVTEDK